MHTRFLFEIYKLDFERLIIFYLKPEKSERRINYYKIFPSSPKRSPHVGVQYEGDDKKNMFSLL